jgi:lipopolysaccharide/colanic/teichoic acid biosynthesis glycosyltransferase
VNSQLAVEPSVAPPVFFELDVAPAPEPHPGFNGIKRAMDVAGAVAVLLLASPILVASIIGILVTSGRPIFFGQQRLGYRGRAFTCWKLRTMVPDAESRRDEVLKLNTTGGPAFKSPEDPRLTRIGKWLRAYSIDELPQAWNILRGDMSLVGPRALPIVENVYEGRQAERLSVRPGLTCTWQVSGRSQITFDRWMEMDLEYVDGRSVWRDIVLLARTPLAVVARRGAM